MGKNLENKSEKKGEVSRTTDPLYDPRLTRLQSYLLGELLHWQRFSRESLIRDPRPIEESYSDNDLRLRKKILDCHLWKLLCWQEHSRKSLRQDPRTIGESYSGT